MKNKRKNTRAAKIAKGLSAGSHGKSNYAVKREYLFENGKWGFELDQKPWKDERCLKS